jgi:fumarate reductase (CoM/CoB) subunit B
MEKVLARVFRYDPSRDDKPRYETYEVPYEKNMRVLDVLRSIQENHDHSLAFRYSCRRRRCGTCSVFVNGKPVLACFEAAKREMVIEPLPHLPIIRDLVVDTEAYEKRTHGIHPYLERKSFPGEPEKVSPRHFEGLKTLQICIECYSCMSVCPVIDLPGEKFAGPAVFVQLAKRALDPRDGLERTSLLLENDLQDCVSCYSCVESCPFKINVLEEAIERLRHQCASRNAGTWAKFNDRFIKQIKNNGLITPFFLMAKTVRPSNWLSNLSILAQFILKRKIGFRKKKIPRREEIKQIFDATGEKK